MNLLNIVLRAACK